MPAITLTPAQRKVHRSGAHHLDPVVMIGNDGLTPAVEKEADQALSAHGLIKLRVFSDDRVAREAMLATLAERLNAAPIQHIGKLLVLWRPLPLKPLVEPREDRGAGPKVVKLVKFSKSGNHRATVKKVRVMGNERVTAGGLVKRAKKPRISSLKKKSMD
jgi:putative YhbY family RNA-binding protein